MTSSRARSTRPGARWRAAPCRCGWPPTGSRYSASPRRPPLEASTRKASHAVSRGGLPPLRARAGDPRRDPRRGALRPRRNRHRRRPGAGVAIPRVAAGGGDRRGARFRLLRRSGGIPPQSCRTKLTYAPARRRVIERLRMSQTLETRSSGSGSDRLTVGVAARLSRYLQVLTQAKKMGKDRISSQEISDYTNINATQIRRDLSAFGKFGKRGVGYNIDSLLGEIRKILRTQGQHNIALIGAGRLGQAIASSSIFAEHGITIAAVFDTDPDKVGRPVGHVEVSDYSRLPEIVHDKNIIVGVLAVPPESAQAAADDLVQSGVRIIFNYSEALLDVPQDVAGQ